LTLNLRRWPKLLNALPIIDERLKYCVLKVWFERGARFGALVSSIGTGDCEGFLAMAAQKTTWGSWYDLVAMSLPKSSKEDPSAIFCAALAPIFESSAKAASVLTHPTGGSGGEGGKVAGGGVSERLAVLFAGLAAGVPECSPVQALALAHFTLLVRDILTGRGGLILQLIDMAQVRPSIFTV
jgi:hypothetical protein